MNVFLFYKNTPYRLHKYINNIINVDIIRDNFFYRKYAYHGKTSLHLEGNLAVVLKQFNPSIRAYTTVIRISYAYVSFPFLLLLCAKVELAVLTVACILYTHINTCVSSVHAQVVDHATAWTGITGDLLYWDTQGLPSLSLQVYRTHTCNRLSSAYYMQCKLCQVHTDPLSPPTFRVHCRSLIQSHRQGWVIPGPTHRMLVERRGSASIMIGVL